MLKYEENEKILKQTIFSRLIDADNVYIYENNPDDIWYHLDMISVESMDKRIRDRISELREKYIDQGHTDRSFLKDVLQQVWDICQNTGAI
jgi:hypothetical protein